MDREADRLQTLIDDLFTLARAEVGQLTLVCHPIDLGALATRGGYDRATGLADQSGSSGAEVQSDVRAIADEGRLDQVLRNLIHNSLRHTPPGGIIAVIARLDRTGDDRGARYRRRYWARRFAARVGTLLSIGAGASA